MPPRQGLDWERDGANWPLRQHSRFVQTPRLRWHVQYAPHADAQAPTVLLLHGTGASTHSCGYEHDVGIGQRLLELHICFPCRGLPHLRDCTGTQSAGAPSA